MTETPPAADGRHRGQCHCGAVTFAVRAPLAVTIEDCNCSICRKSGYLHLLVPADCLNVTQGTHDLVAYRFNTGTAVHTFCRHCGVKPFYVPRSNPDGYSVNLRCLERSTFTTITVVPFDGRNWERNAASLRERTRPRA